MGSVQPGEAGIEAAQKALEDADVHLHARMDSIAVQGAPAHEIAEDVIAAYLSADPASALRELLRHPEAREALREMNQDARINAVLDEMARVFIDYGANLARLNPNDMRMVAVRLSRSVVDALASGVEGERE